MIDVENQQSFRAGFFNTEMVQRKHMTEATNASIKLLSEAGNTKQVAASQIELLSEFYKLAIEQATRSFRSALLVSGAGFIFLLFAIGMQLYSGQGTLNNGAIIPLVSGAIIEFIAGVMFYLYSKTVTQLNLNQDKLATLQRFLLADSITSSLKDGEREDKTRAKLIDQLITLSFERPDYEQSARLYARRSRLARSGESSTTTVTTDDVHSTSEGNPTTANSKE